MVLRLNINKVLNNGKPSGDRDGTTYVIKSEDDFIDFINKYKKECAFLDLEGITDWQVVSRDDDHSDMWDHEKDDKEFPCGYKLMINEYENKPNVIDYLENKIENIETFYLS